jgi:hypothetical protein
MSDPGLPGPYPDERPPWPPEEQPGPPYDPLYDPLSAAQNDPLSKARPGAGPVTPAPLPAYPWTEPAPYRGVGLVPAAGAARTWGLAVIGAPLSLVVLLGLVTGIGASGGGHTATAPGWYSGAPSDSGDGSQLGGLVPSWTPPPQLPTQTPYSATSAPNTFADPAATGTATPDGLFGTASDPGTPNGTGTGTGAAGGTAPGDPRGVVTAFFDAINSRDYSTAWQLGGENLDSDYDTFVRGYATTRRDTITIVSVRTAARQSVVRLALDAEQTDGTSQSYDAAYTVTDGEITHGTATPTN